jgi:hypothetical protein
MRQNLRNGWLNNYVGGMAERAIGMKRLTVGMRMPNLHDPAKENEGAAKEGERHPERMSCSRIEDALWHC